VRPDGSAGRGRRIAGPLLLAAGIVLFVVQAPHTENCGPAYDHLCTTRDDLAFATLFLAVAIGVAGLLTWSSGRRARRDGPHEAAMREAGPATLSRVELPGRREATLRATGDRKIDVIKTYRALAGVGLREAKDAADRAPVSIGWVEPERAAMVRDAFARAGAVVEIDEPPVPTPRLIQGS
jgi:large subunit ribosomal protein L7/L12